MQGHIQLKEKMLFSKSKILCGAYEVLGGNFSIFLLCNYSIVTSVPLIQMLQGESHYRKRWVEMLEGASSRKAMSLSLLLWEKSAKGQNEIWFCGWRKQSKQVRWS